jgi:hypothetical protein
MKVNKAVYMTFGAGESTSTTNINITFDVKKIRCINAGYMTSTPPAVGDASYLFVNSDLTQNTPIAMIYQDSTHPYSSGNNIEFIFQTPQPVNGVFTFSLLSFLGTANIGTVGGDQLGLILEFSDGNEE